MIELDLGKDVSRSVFYVRLVDEGIILFFISSSTTGKIAREDLAHFKVTLSMLLASKDHPHGCQLCLCDVGGYPSIGIPTDEKDDPADLRHHDRHAVLQFHKRG
ncbi:unnamed protein product, partial [Pylaiella littoralis]